MTTTEIKLGDIAVQVVHKDIKNIHLSVYPPNGSVRIAAPLRMKLDTIRVFAISKLAWIKQQQKKLRAQERETPREYLDRESHYVWGKRYLLKVTENVKPARVELKHKQIRLYLGSSADEAKKQAVLESWYRQQLKQEALPIIAKWEKIMAVKVERLYVRKMKTKWGSCQPLVNSIRLNLELAKKPLNCLEYIIVHEMTHLMEPTHNNRFIALLGKFMPQWRTHRDELNRLPVSHQEWIY